MPLRKPGRLRPVHQIGQRSATEPGVDLVVIPGVWNDNTPGRMKGSCSWVQPLAASTDSDTRVFLFNYRLELDGSSLWEQLLGQGYALISGLEESRALPEDHRRPLLFICHSLGGFILKRALTVGVKSAQTYQDATAGVVFLGTPHILDDREEGWAVVQLLMKANRKEISKSNMTDSEINNVIFICRQFDRLQLDVAFLSVYEAIETKYKNTIFNRMNRNSPKVLVTKAMVHLNAAKEKLFEVNKTHTDLCDVEEFGPLYERLVQFFSMIVLHAPKNANYSFCQIPHSAPDSASLLFRKNSSSIASPSTRDSFSPKVYTPGTETSAANEQVHSTISSAVVGDKDDDFDVPRPESVSLPFAFTGSVVRNPRFYGRSDVIEEIDYAFGLKPRPGHSVGSDHNIITNEPKTYVLCGMAGIGKTETASEYLFSRMGQFDAVIWVWADTTRKLGAQFVTLAKELGGEAVSEGVDEISAREFVKAWLATPVGHRIERGRSVKAEVMRWLMVMDNADDPDTLYDWLPAQGPGCILVTGKYPYVKESAYRLENGLDLEIFTAETGGDMLRKLSGRGHGDEAITASNRIAETLGGLPFAIAQMSDIIRENHLTFQDFEDWYHEEPQELFHLRTKGMRSTYKHTIATAWALEYLSKSALALLRVVSLLDPDRIAEEILIDGAKDINFPDYPVRKHMYFKTRAELLHVSLITRNMAANELHIHRLVQEVIRYRMNKTQLTAAYAAVSRLLSTVWPYVSGTDPTRHQAWRVQVAERFAPHISKLEDLFGSLMHKDDFQGTATGGFLFSSYAWYLSERGAPQQTEVFASLACKVLKLAQDQNSDGQERISHWLGEAYHSLSLSACITGVSDGLKEVRMWHSILQERIDKYDLPTDKLALGTAYNQMGICFMNKDKTKDAIESFRQSVETYKTVEKAPQFSGTFPAISLANIHMLEGRPDKAEDVLTPFLEEHEAILGQQDISTTRSGHIWRIMGNIKNAQQRFHEGLDYHTRALNNLRATCGDKHYFTGDCRYSLANDFARQGDHQRALENLDHAIEIYSAASHCKPQAARALWKKACLLRDDGDEKGSKTLMAQAMELRQELVPGDTCRAEELGDNYWTRLIIYWSR